MKILKITDLPDGSANIEFEITEEEQKIFVEYAILDILTKSAEKTIKEYEENN